MTRQRHRLLRLLPRWLIACLVGMLAAVALTSFGAWLSTQQAEQATDRAVRASSSASAAVEERNRASAQAEDVSRRVLPACRKGGDVRRELDRTGACAKASQVAATPVPGPSGPPGRPPSPQEIAQAVDVYCAAHGDCSEAPTAGQVADAVEAYCDDRGQCRGPKGDAGDKGDSGDPPSDEQVATAVATYCAAHGDCKGPPGADGKDGTDGEDGADGRDGRGIQSVECREDGTWVITYTDGTTQTADGPCRTQVAPQPPTPTGEP